MKISNGAANCLKDMMSDVSKLAPFKGRRVEIAAGKHKGLRGVVTWHGADRFNPPHRYDGNGPQKAMTAASGRNGYRIRVVDDQGNNFFTSASYAIVLDGPCYGVIYDVDAQRVERAATLEEVRKSSAYRYMIETPNGRRKVYPWTCVGSLTP